MIATVATMPLLVSGANLAQDHPGRRGRRHSDGLLALGRLVGVHGSGVQEVGAQAPRTVDREAVEVQPVLLAGRGGAGPDPHRRQAEQPLDRLGGHLHGPDAVQARGEHVLVDQSATQLDPASADPEARGEVAQDPERDRDRDAQQLPLDVGPAGRPAEHEEPDQHRQEPQHLADRVDQQHPSVETLPLALADESGRRGGHVASPGTASGGGGRRSRRPPRTPWSP
jgi:hypothetical protein